MNKYVKLNIEKVRELIETDGRNMQEISFDMGVSRSYISNSLGKGNKMGAGVMNKGFAKVLAHELRVELDYILEPEVVEKTEEIVTEEEINANDPIVANYDLTPVLVKLDELIVTINKLGNIEMQNMEYLKQVRDLLK